MLLHRPLRDAEIAKVISDFLDERR